jgi:hypothetical protein
MFVLQGLMQSSSYASLQAAYQEVHSFAMFGGAGSHSVAANLHTLKGSAGGVQLQQQRVYLHEMSMHFRCASFVIIMYLLTTATPAVPVCLACRWQGQVLTRPS